MGWMSDSVESRFHLELTELIRRYTLDTIARTPDYLLAQYLCDALDVFARTVTVRDNLEAEP